MLSYIPYNLLWNGLMFKPAGKQKNWSKPINHLKGLTCTSAFIISRVNRSVICICQFSHFSYNLLPQLLKPEFVLVTVVILLWHPSLWEPVLRPSRLSFHLQCWQHLYFGTKSYLSFLFNKCLNVLHNNAYIDTHIYTHTIFSVLGHFV